MPRIFVIDAERRNWARRLKTRKSSDAVSAVTRRYLIITESENLRKIIWKEFSGSPNAIVPHESGREMLFYCIAGPSCRRPKRLVSSLLHKLKKNHIAIDSMEVLTA